MLMNGAPLHRHAVPHCGDRLVQPGRAIDDEELGPPQAALDEIVEHGTPGLGALATHALDREHHLLDVLAYADDDEQRDGGRFAVEPHAHHRAVENEPHDRLVSQRAGVPGVPVGLHLPPHPAHRVLAHRTAKQGGERTAHPARVGARQIGARDQCVGGQGAALISPQRLALPLRRLALRGIQSGTWNRDLDRPEGPGQRPRPAPMAVARNACSSFIADHPASTVTRASKRSVELAADHPFDELTRPSAHLGLDRIEPGVEKINSHLRCRLRRIRLRGSACHGVVSSPALQCRMIRG